MNFMKEFVMMLAGATWIVVAVVALAYIMGGQLF